MSLNFNVYHPDAPYFKEGENIPVKYAWFSFSPSASDQTIVSAVTGKKIRVVHFDISSSGSAQIAFRSKPSGTGSYITPTIYLVANTQYPRDYCPVGYFETVADEALAAIVSTTLVAGYLGYIEVE